MVRWLYPLVVIFFLIGGAYAKSPPEKPSPTTKEEKKKEEKKKVDKKFEDEEKDDEEKTEGGGQKKQDESYDEDEDEDEDSEKSKKEKKKPKKPESPWRISGDFSLSYRLRTSRDDADQDIWGVMGIDARYRKKNQDLLKLVVHGTGKIDFDNTEEHTFFSLEDTFRGASRFELYTAYVEARIPDSPLMLRAGRQHRWEVIGIHFDGLALRAEALQKKAWMEIFGGSPVRYFESSRDENWIMGANMGIKLSPKLTAEFTYIHLRDKISSPGQELQDDYYGFKAKLYPFRNLYLWGQYSLIGDRPRRGEAHARLGLPKLNAYMGGSLIWQSSNILNFSTEFSQYYPILVQTRPYIYAQLFVMKEITKNLMGRLQGEVRSLLEKNETGLFNHNFQRIFTTLVYTNLFLKGLEFNTSLSYWNGEGKQNIFAVDGEIAYKPDQKWKFALGSRYQLYKYRFNYNDERVDSRSIYFEALCKFLKGAQVRIFFELEDPKEKTTYSLFFEVRYSF